jgi:transposase
MRSVDMTDGICFAGLDVHARKTVAAAVQSGSGEVFRARLGGEPRAAALEVMVCSPGAIPRQPGDQVKTDARDALKLARLLAAGQLRPVVVPAPELEALRDLVRAREDLRGDLMAARHAAGQLPGTDTV